MLASGTVISIKGLPPRCSSKVLGFLDGVVRHGKRQLGNNDLHAGRAGQVKAFGKTVEAENNAGFTFGNGLMVPL